MEEKTVYQITGYQAIYQNGTRDNVKLLVPVLTENLDSYRKHTMHKYGCTNVNLAYVEIPIDEINI